MTPFSGTSRPNSRARARRRRATACRARRGCRRSRAAAPRSGPRSPCRARPRRPGRCTGRARRRAGARQRSYCANGGGKRLSTFWAVYITTGRSGGAAASHWRAATLNGSSWMSSTSGARSVGAGERTAVRVGVAIDIPGRRTGSSTIEKSSSDRLVVYLRRPLRGTTRVTSIPAARSARSRARCAGFCLRGKRALSSLISARVSIEGESAVPTGFPDSLTPVARFIEEWLQPYTVLDVGVGGGRMGFLAREYGHVPWHPRARGHR